MLKLHLFNRALIPVTLLSMVVSLLTPLPALAATKTIVDTAPYSPGQSVTVQIDYTKPVISVNPSAELVVVVDTSGSIASTISTMKTKLINFVNNTLQNYPGAVRVGIVKIGNGTAGFDDDPSNDALHAENANMYPLHSTNAYSNSTVGYDKVATISTSADYTRLVNAINAIKVEPATNPNSLDGANSYTSDIGVGLNRAKGMFHSDATSKFVILITDGLVNKSYCPIDSTNKVATTFPSGTFLQVVPGGTEWTANTYVQTQPGDGSTDPIFPASYPTTNGEPGVCFPYIANYHNATGWRAQQFTQDIANHYGPNSIQSTDIDTNALATMIDDVTIDTATIDDNLNPAVFSAVTSWVGMYDCSSGSPTSLFSGTTWTPSGTEALAIAPQTLLNRSTRFCLRFKATLAAGPPGGSQPINQPGQVITYKNAEGDVIATDPITQGSMSIISDVNLAPYGFVLTDDSSSTARYQFLTNQPVYVRANVQNSGSDDSASGAVTRFYSDQQTNLSQNSVKTPDLWITHSSIVAGATPLYESRPGGNRNASFSSSSGLDYWTKSTPGTYWGRIFVNYQTSSGPVYETDYTDNQTGSPIKYEVMPATDITIATPTPDCTSATINWTNTSAITKSYKITYTPASGSPASGATTNTTSLSLTGLTKNTTYTLTVTPYAGLNGSGAVGIPATNIFSTSNSGCLAFTLSPVSGKSFSRGATGNTVVTTDYSLNGASNIPAWTAQNAQLTIGIVGFVTGTAPTACNSFPNPTNYNNTPPAGSGLSATMATTGTTSQTMVPTLYGSPTVSVAVAANAPVGSYTLCMGGYSTAASPTDVAVKPLTFSIKPDDPWLQVGGANASATSAGDVHSNGDLSISAPTAPVQKYFLLPNTAGVVSAAKTMSPSSVQVASVVTNSWQWSSYHQIDSPLYTDLVANSPIEVDGKVTSGSPSPTQMATACAAANPNYQAANTVDISSGPMAFAPTAGCEGKDVVYFINGDLNVHTNIVDTTKYGTITFIIKGNLTIDPTVTELDGAYLFGGSFADGTGNNISCGAVTSPDCQLVVKGSLLGMGGIKPTDATGNFRSSSGSGFQRDLGTGNDTTPGELIYFQPKYLDQLKGSLGSSTFSWTE